MVNIRVWKKYPKSQTVYPTEFGIALDKDEYTVLKVTFLKFVSNLKNFPKIGTHGKLNAKVGFDTKR